MKKGINIYSIVIYSLLIMVIASCAVKKYIPEDESLYTGAEVIVLDTMDIKDKTGLQTELQSVLYPAPNTSFLGLYPGLHFHYKANSEKSNFIARFMNKRFGEEPVYLSDVNLENMEELLENRLLNSGFFKPKVKSSILKDSASKSATTKYVVEIGKPYKLNQYILEIDSADSALGYPIYKEIQRAIAESPLVKGVRYDLGSFKNERKRIDQELKKKGYYNFNPTFILFQADTNLNNNKTFNLYLTLKDGVPAKAKVPYVLNKVLVYPNVTSDTSDISHDTTIVENVKFLQDEIFFKPDHLRPFILLKPGERYDPVESSYTSRRISSIGTYKFINIDYEMVDSTGTDTTQIRYLNTIIALSPLTKRSIRTSLEAVTKSNNFAGPQLALTYLNRNLFKEGVNFTTSGNIAFEKQIGVRGTGSTSIQFGLKSTFSFPRLLFPVNVDKFFRYAIPKTNISLGADYFNRTSLYSLISYTFEFGYVWNANKFVTHHLNPIEINYLQLRNTSERFDSILENNPFLALSFEQQFIAGLTYTFFYNELNRTNKKGKINFRFNFDMAGNALDLIAGGQNNGSDNTVFGISYAQYVRGDIDLSYNYSLTEKGHALVGRVFGGIGVPYGNSEILPFIKKYFSGGAYSVRAFQIRGLGPGVYEPENEDNFFFDRSGDIRLEGNLEYRFPIITYLNGALFADAGNIWNLDDRLEGGEFTPDFITQFGVGTGFGLRVDIQGFVIRFDLAFPLKNPASGWKFGLTEPRFNFAVGYPF